MITDWIGLEVEDIIILVDYHFTQTTGAFVTEFFNVVFCLNIKLIFLLQQIYIYFVIKSLFILKIIIFCV